MAAFTSSAEVLGTTAATAEVPVIIHFSYTFYGLQVKLSICNISYYTFLKITILFADSKKPAAILSIQDHCRLFSFLFSFKRMNRWDSSCSIDECLQEKLLTGMIGA